MNKYDKYLHKLILLDIKYSEDYLRESYRFHKIACKDALRERNENNIDGIKKYIKELKNIFEPFSI